MRSTRDLLRRRTHFVRKRGQLMARIQNTFHQYNLPRPPRTPRLQVPTGTHFRRVRRPHSQEERRDRFHPLRHLWWAHPWPRKDHPPVARPPAELPSRAALPPPRRWLPTASRPTV